MRLYHSPTTPYGRKVMVLLHETGQTEDIEVVIAGGTPLDPSNQPVSVNPLGKIPALLLDDGTSLFDSRVICRYLDARAGTGLYPAGPAVWPVLTLEALADGILEAALLMVYETRLRPQEIRFPPWVDGQWAKIARALDTLEAKWMTHLSGPLDMGQLALACALAYLDFRLEARNWRQGHPQLAVWEAKMADRPGLMATRPQG